MSFSSSSSENRIFVGGLSASTNKSCLYEYFKNYGYILNATILTNKSNKSRGFGFVEFKDPSSIADIMKFQYHNINGKIVECKVATPKDYQISKNNSILKNKDISFKHNNNADQANKVFLGGLAQTINEENLHSYFSKYGKLKQCIVMREKITKRSRCFGFIVYFDNYSIIKLISSQQEHILHGKKIDIKLAVSKEEISEGKEILSKFIDYLNNNKNISNYNVSENEKEEKNFITDNINIDDNNNYNNNCSIKNNSRGNILCQLNSLISNLSNINNNYNYNQIDNNHCNSNTNLYKNNQYLDNQNLILRMVNSNDLNNNVNDNINNDIHNNNIHNNVNNANNSIDINNYNAFHNTNNNILNNYIISLIKANIDRNNDIGKTTNTINLTNNIQNCVNLTNFYFFPPINNTSNISNNNFDNKNIISLNNNSDYSTNTFSTLNTCNNKSNNSMICKYNNVTSICENSFNNDLKNIRNNNSSYNKDYYDKFENSCYNNNNNKLNNVLNDKFNNYSNKETYLKELDTNSASFYSGNRNINYNNTKSTYTNNNTYNTDNYSCNNIRKINNNNSNTNNINSISLDDKLQNFQPNTNTTIAYFDDTPNMKEMLSNIQEKIKKNKLNQDYYKFKVDK